MLYNTRYYVTIGSIQMLQLMQCVDECIDNTRQLAISAHKERYVDNRRHLFISMYKGRYKLIEIQCIDIAQLIFFIKFYMKSFLNIVFTLNIWTFWSTLFVTYPTVLDISIDSKIDLFQFYDKYMYLPSKQSST